MKHFLILCALASAYLLTPRSFADALENHDAIYAAARDYIKANLTTQVDYEININALDPRLQFAACTKPLEVFNSSVQLKPGRNSIGVRCSATQGWSLYLTADIQVFENIVFMAQSVKRGEILKADQLTMKRRDIAQLRPGYIKDLNTALDQQATRNLAADTQLNSQDFSKATVIKRGEIVAISSSNPYLNIRMQGLAMSDGAIGQSIRVKNTSSGRSLNGIVVQQGLVSVNY